MNADIERMLEGEGADLRAFVDSLRAAPQARVEEGFADGVRAAVRAERLSRACRFGAFRTSWALSAAAGLAVCLALGILFDRSAKLPVSPGAELVACQRADGTFSDSSASAYVQAFAVTVLARDAARTPALDSAVGALMRSQNAAGGWENDAVSARNVLALRTAVDAGAARARAAYRRGLRYLHARGIDELTMPDLVREARVAHARLGVVGDAGLARCAALCAAL